MQYIHNTKSRGYNQAGTDVEVGLSEDERSLCIRSSMLKRVIMQVQFDKVTSVLHGSIPTYLQAVVRV
jgi:hypothetical protein